MSVTSDLFGYEGEKDEAYYCRLWDYLNNPRIHSDTRKWIIEILKEDGRWGDWRDEDE